MRPALLIGLFILTSCGSGDKKGEPAAPSPVTQAEPQHTANPTPVGGPASTAPPPPDFTMPDFAPLYPGAKIQSVNNATGSASYEVRLATSDSADQVAAFYRDRFAAAGMRKTSDFLSGGTAMMSAIGQGRQASIAITKEADHNAVIVTYTGR